MDTNQTTTGREDLLDIVPLKANGDRGCTLIIARTNYDSWLATSGPDLAAAGYVRLVKTDHVHYEDQQL